MRSFLQLLAREFKLFNQNKVLRILFIGAPIMYGILIGSVYEKGKVTDLPIVVVDEDQSVMSQKLITMLGENEVIYVSDILPNTQHSRTIALEKEAPCVVLIPKDFEKNLYQKRYPELTVFVDASNTLTANFAANAINVSAQTFKVGIQVEGLKKQGLSETVAMTQYEPFKTTIIKQNIRSGNYLYFMLPGVLLTVFQQVLLLGLALTFSAEFENGTFRSLVERIRNPLGLIAVKVIPYMLMSIGIIVLYYGFSIYYRLPLKTDLAVFGLATMAFIAAVSFLGILVSILLPNQLKATEVLMVVATPSFIISGFTWPLSQMPVWVQHVANCIPLTHYLKIYRTLFVEQGTMHQIQGPLNALLITSGICLTIAAIALNVKIKKEHKLRVLEKSVPIPGDSTQVPPLA